MPTFRGSVLRLELFVGVKTLTGNILSLGFVANTNGNQVIFMVERLVVR